MPLFKLLRMDRLRRSLRESFRKKKDHVPECSKPHQWQADEVAVRDGTCSFPVKYLGCVEVFESRGMQVCEEALKMLRNSRRRSIKGVLYVTGDGLRVVDDDTKGLIVDQTIEKVSFCAPDRNHEKGFSYICRDGTTRRWMCHGFLAVKDSGERLSHAVGCAFAACLERKQKRDKECGVTMTFDPNNSTFTRMGSFKQTTMTERMQDAQDCKPAGNSISSIRPGLPSQAPADSTDVLTPTLGRCLTESVPAKPIHNPYAIERPHATPMMLQRQGSFRGFGQLNQTSPFKRQLSLRITDLPSNLERQQRSMSLESSDFSKPTSPVSPDLPSRTPRTRLHSLPNAVHSANMSPIPESSPVGDRQPTDSISAMCQQLAHGLTMLSNDEDPFSRPFGSTPASAPPTMSTMPSVALNSQGSRNGVSEGVQDTNPWVASSAASGPSRAEVWLSSNVNATCSAVGPVAPPGCGASSSTVATMTSSTAAVTKSTSNPLDLFGSNFGAKGTGAPVPSRLPPHQKPSTSVLVAPPRRAPHITHLRSQSLGAPPSDQKQHPSPSSRVAFPKATTASAPVPQPATLVNSWSSLNGNSSISSTNDSSHSTTVTFSTSSLPYRDPFDAEWAELAARTQPSTNPFSQNSVKAFEIHM